MKLKVFENKESEQTINFKLVEECGEKMNFEVFKEKEDDKIPEKSVYFTLEKTYKGIVLKAVDINGKDLPRNNILRINTDGTFYKYSSVNENIGLDLI